MCDITQPVKLSTFQQNDYTKFEMEQLSRSHGRVKPAREEDDIIRGVTGTAFCSTVTNRLTRVLQRRNVQTVSYPLTKK